MLVIIKRLFLIVAISLSGANCMQLFQMGKEYKYQYQGLFTTGTEEPVSYASTYRLYGTLRLQPSSATILRAKLEDMKIGMYNGRWSYFPIPQFNLVDDDRLSTLQEPFNIELTEEGKFKTLTMNDQEPEFASNIKRGLATYLQMNLTSGLSSVNVFKDLEATTMGECSTNYVITPSSASSTTVSKFRNHADCPDIPKRTRHGNKAFFECPSSRTRDTINSTSYAVYEIALDDKQNPTINKITVLSSILYWPFTSSGQFLYTWFNLTVALDTIDQVTSPIPGPENAENHEDLSFVFEQSDTQDFDEEIPDLKTVEPFYFHQTVYDAEPETMEALSTKVILAIEKTITSFDVKMDDFKEDFHENSPNVVSKLLAHMDYESLLNLYKYFHGKYTENKDNSIQLQLYVDSLTLCGTGASSLVLRDIILETTCPKMLARILPFFHQNIRNPSETLAKEFDSISQLLNKDTLDKSTKRSLELSIANLMSRCCKRNLCATSGLLDKYIAYFEKKYMDSDTFDEKTTAIICLRNLREGKSLDKVLDIVLGNTPANTTIRIQAIWSLRPLFRSIQHRNNEQFAQTMLKIFFNRNESWEIRTSVFGTIISTGPNERTLHEIAYYMWSETCPQTLNLVRSTLANMAKSAAPCAKISSYAQTVLKYLPPGEIDPTRTTAYSIEYYDEENGYGKSIYANVQKSGNAALPVSFYFGSTYYIGSYGSSPFGIYVRMQGIERYKAIFSNFENGISIDKVLKIISSLKVAPRKGTPLMLEFQVLYLDQVIYYFAADQDTLKGSLIGVAKEIQNLQKMSMKVQQSFLMGEVLYQQPLELGIPMSILTSGTAMYYFANNVKPKSSVLEIDSKIRSEFFMSTMISNHVPAIGLIHSAGLLRTVKMNDPKHVIVTKDTENLKTNIKFYPPPADDPAGIQSHGTGFISITSENLASADYEELLRKSCPTCQKYTLASKGPNQAQSKNIITVPTLTDGVKVGVRTFMCEKHISGVELLKRLRKFDDSTKNRGNFGTTFASLMLGYQQTIDYMFLWPHPEPCGFILYGSKASNSTYSLSEMDISFNVTVSKSGDLKMEATTELKYDGSSPPPTKAAHFRLHISPDKEGSQKLELKGSLTGKTEGYTWLGCINVENHAMKPMRESWGFEGDDEPSVNQTIRVTVGKVAGNETVGQCSDDQANISIVGVAGRSAEQVHETFPGQSVELPYIFCNVERAIGKWPKNYIPPTADCQKIVFDQTNLRLLNFTVKYKVAEEVQKRWTRPLGFVQNLLSPYSVDPTKDTVHHESKQAKQQSRSEKYIEGEIEIDMNLRKHNPVMNVHFIESTPKQLEQHYNDFDLNFLPQALHLKPAPSRFSYLTQFAMKVGLLGTCGVTSNYVITFDNLKYAVNMSSDCETIIAADCSELPAFAITARSINSKLSSIGVQFQESYLELSPNGISFQGVNIQYDEDGQFRHKDVICENNHHEISVQSLGVEVKYSINGGYVHVVLGSIYRGVACGLCGNFDTTAANDLQGPSASTCPINSMIDAWTLKTRSCQTIANYC